MGIHLGIIMDGNRRFAKKLMLEPWKGHEFGAKKTEEVLDWCSEHKIDELTLYAFSVQNFNRPKHEFDFLMKVFAKEQKQFLEEEHKIHKQGLRVKFLGRLDLFPQSIQDGCKEIEEKTKDNENFLINICFGYGGREEMVDAIHNIAKDVSDGKLKPVEVDEELIDKYVYSSSQPDLIIRTGGDHRTSNFLIWQSAYSEWFFFDKTWPELTKEDFNDILADFKKRERRFGR